MKSLLFGTTGTINLINSGNKYGFPWGLTTLGGASANEFMVPSPGTIRKLWVKLSAVPGAGKSWTFTFMKNGYNSQAVTVTISGDTDTEGSDTTHSFTVSSSEIANGTNGICLQVVPSGAPTACRARWGFEFEGDTLNESIHGSGYFGNLSQTLQQFMVLDGSVVWPLADETKAFFVVPCAGTLKNLCATLSVAPGASKSRTFTVRKLTPPGSSADTAVTLTISDTATYGTSGATSVAVAAGDLICISSTMTPTDGTVAAGQVKTGLTFVASVNGEFFINLSDRSLSPNRDTLNYCLIQGANTLWTTTLYDAQQVVPVDFTVKAFYVDLNGAPGAGKDYAFHLNKNGTDIAATLVQIADTNTAGNVTGLTEEIVAGDDLSLAIDGTGTPAYTSVAASLVGSLAVSAPLVPSYFLFF